MLVLSAVLFLIAFTTFFYAVAATAADNLGMLRQRSFRPVPARPRTLEELLESAETRRLVSIGGAIFGVLVGLNLRAGFAVTAAIAGLAAFAPVGLLMRRARKRRQLLESQIVIALTMIADGMRAGKTLPQTIDATAAAMSRPMSQELSVVSRQMRVGIKPEDALRSLAARVGLADLNLAVKAMSVSIQTGANLPQASRRIVDTISNRSRVESKIRVLTTQGKWQGIILGFFPFFLLAGFWVMNPGYIDALFRTTIGNLILGVVFVLQCIAVIVMRRIIAVKV